MNSVSLVGRPTKDPELKFTPGGAAVCTFILAVDRGFKNKEGKREADFIRVKAWNKTAEYIANYGTKGRLISVAGRIVTDISRERDGSNKYWTEVVVENIGFLGPKRDDEAVENKIETAGDDGFSSAKGEEDNPFEEN